MNAVVNSGAGVPQKNASKIIPDFIPFKISVKKHGDDKVDRQSSGYEPLNVTSAEQLIEVMNTYHCVFSTLKNGTRIKSEVTEMAPVIKLDIDAENGALEEVIEKLKGYSYVKVPSQSDKDYKAHIIVLCDGQMDVEYYKTQIDNFLLDSGIDVGMIDSKPLYSASGYLAPASCGRALTVKSANAKSFHNEGKRYKLREPSECSSIPNKTKSSNANTQRGLLKGLPTVKGEVIVKDVKSDKVNVLMPESIVYYFGRPVLVKDVQEAILAINCQDTIYGGFSCPTANPEHTMDLVSTPYSFAFISSVGNDVIFKCSGNACSHKPETIIDKPKDDKKPKDDDANDVEKPITLEMLYDMGVAVDLESSDLESLHEANIIFDRALHLFFAPSGFFKSFTVVKIVADINKDKFYLDFEHNPSNLKKHCQEHGIQYVTPPNTMDELNKLLEAKADYRNALFIFDSFSNLIAEGNNDTTETSTVVKLMHELCVKKGATVIFIDHATKKDNKDKVGGEKEWNFKLEGNESGKKKPCELVYMIQPNSLQDYNEGVKLLTTKSRTPLRRMNQIFDPFEEENCNAKF